MILVTYQIISRENSDLHWNSSRKLSVILHVDKLNEFLSPQQDCCSALTYFHSNDASSQSRDIWDRRAGVCEKSRWARKFDAEFSLFVWHYVVSLSYIRLI